MESELERYRGILEPLVYSHVWLGIGAGAQAGFAVLFGAELFHGGNDDLRGSILYVLLMCTSTVALYGIHRLLGLRRLDAERLTGRWRVVAERRTQIKHVAFVCAVASGLLYAFLPYAWQWRILVPGAIGLLYVLPVFRGKRLRDAGIAKVLWLSLGWVGLTIWVPMASIADGQAPMDHFPRLAMWIICAERLLFMLSHSLAFDFRDVEFDLADGVRTLPTRIGRVWSRRVSISLLVASIALALLGPTRMLYTGGFFGGAALVAISVLAIPLVWRAFAVPVRSDLYYGFALDGLFAIPGLTVIGFMFILLAVSILSQSLASG